MQFFVSFASPFNTKLYAWPHNMHPPPVFVHHFSFQIVYCLLPTPWPISKASSNLTAFTFIVHVSNPLGFIFGYHYRYSVARFVAKFGCPSLTAEEYSEPAASKVWWYRPQSQVKKKQLQHYITISYAQMHITSWNSGRTSIFMSLHSICLGWI